MMAYSILMVDTETANTLDCPLAYNIGGIITNRKGEVKDSFSYLIKEVFEDETALMQSAYYADKIPQYKAQIASGEIELVTLAEAVNKIRELCVKHGVNVWCAHNARFDNKSMNTTERYVTKSKYRYFLPYGLVAWDTMKMAQDVICKMPTYVKFCQENGYVCKNGQVRKTAEVLYKFITKNTDFKEEHKALEDVLIETEILKYCFRQHKKMRKELWEN